MTYYHREHAPADAPAWPSSTDHPVYCGGDAAYWGKPDAIGCGEVIEDIPLTAWGRREYVTGGNVDPLPVNVTA